MAKKKSAPIYFQPYKPKRPTAKERKERIAMEKEDAERRKAEKHRVRKKMLFSFLIAHPHPDQQTQSKIDEIAKIYKPRQSYHKKDKLYRCPLGCKCGIDDPRLEELFNWVIKDLTKQQMTEFGEIIDNWFSQNPPNDFVLSFGERWSMRV